MTNFGAICKAVEHGAGAAIVPERAARSYRKPTINIIALGCGAWQRLVEHLKAK
jgi:hypothetical protein